MLNGVTSIRVLDPVWRERPREKTEKHDWIENQGKTGSEKNDDFLWGASFLVIEQSDLVTHCDSDRKSSMAKKSPNVRLRTLFASTCLLLVASSRSLLVGAAYTTGKSFCS